MPAALARTAATGMLSVKRTGTARPSASERVSRTGQPHGSAISAASPESAIAQSRGGAAAASGVCQRIAVPGPSASAARPASVPSTAPSQIGTGRPVTGAPPEHPDGPVRRGGRAGAATGRPAPPARSLRQVLAHRLELEPFLLGLGEPLLPHVQRLGGLAELHRLAGIEVGVREQPLELADLRLQPLDLPGQVV